MDEVSFGPSREARPPSRRRRAFTAAASVAAVAAAGAALAVTAPSAYHAMTSRYPAAPSAAPPAALSHLPSKGCPPARAAWPSLAGLPAGMRPGAVPVIVDAQFSGRCTAP